MAVKLTSLSHGAGCGCKLPASVLHPMLAGFPAPDDPRVLVGSATADDAAVYQLREDLAIVQTVDFFTPIVDDPYDFGRIAATNALSDVYAMGGEPVSALNLVAFPLETLGGDVLAEILRGGRDAVADAGASIVGGHSIDDPEPKYGLAVTGVVRPRATCSPTRAGGRATSSSSPSRSAPAWSRRPQARDGRRRPRRASDGGHVRVQPRRRARRARGRRARADRRDGVRPRRALPRAGARERVAAELDAAAVPAIDGVLELLEAGEEAVAGGTRRNREWSATFTTFGDDVPEARRWLACDAMTSGGLLAAVPPERAGEATGVVVGRLSEGEPGHISVR